MTIEGVVTGLFDGGQADNPNWLIFVQDTGDEDEKTSDGLPVYVGKQRPDIAIGDRVTVTGEVTEFFELTEITRANVNVLEHNVALPEPTTLAANADLETLEGMLVRVVDVKANQTGRCRFEVVGEITPLTVLMPDDSLCVQIETADQPIAEIVGVLTFHFGEYKLILQSALDTQTEIRTTWEQSPIDCLLITEIYYDSFGRDYEEEWIELTNNCPETMAVGQFKLGDAEEIGGSEGIFRFPDNAVIEAGRSVVIAQQSIGFERAFGFRPNFELAGSEPSVPDMQQVQGTIELANAGDSVVLLDENDDLIDAVSYGDNETFLQPAPLGVGEGQSLGRRFGDCDAGMAADFIPQQPSPGVVIFNDSCSIAPSLEPDQRVPIGAIQGNTTVSPFVNQHVTFEGVVTGWHEDRNTRGITFYTLYVQDLVGREDGDPTTSDGIAVFLGQARPMAQIGDHVRVAGLVTEFFGLTELDDEGVSVEVLSSDNVLPTPLEIAPQNSADLAALFEPLEAMRVHLGFGAARVVGATFDGCGFSVMREDAGVGRVYRREAADPIGAVIPVLHRSDVDCSDFPNLKLNDVISGLSGVLTYNFDQFKLLTQDFTDVIVDAAPFPEPPAAPEIASGQFSVVSFNVENLFDGVDDTGDDAEPKLGERELAVKLAKLAYALGVTAGCPTVVAVQEVEKATLLEDLANGVAQYCEMDYEVVHQESADARGIDLAYMVDSSRVVVLSAELQRACTTIDTNISDPDAGCENGQEPLFSRPPFLLTARIDGQIYTFINNHFKSKRGGEFETQARRVEQAKFLRTLLEQNIDERMILIGDFNDYEDAEPLRILEAAGLENVLKRVPSELRYTFVFGGIAQLIDGVFISDVLRDEVTTVTILHTNADYPDSLGRNLERMAFKATDHDLPFVVFDVEEQVDEVIEEEPPAEDSLWILWGGIVAMVLAGVGVGFVVGRRKPASDPTGQRT